MILTDEQLAQKNRDLYERTGDIVTLASVARLKMFASSQNPTSPSSLFRDTYSALQDALTAARAATALMDQLHNHMLDMDAPQLVSHPLPDECGHQKDVDDICIRPTELHTDVCALHADYDTLNWHDGHKVTECCGACCNGSTHYDDEGEEIAA